MINFRVENIEKRVDYLRELETGIVDEISCYPHEKFVHILGSEGNAIELRVANDDTFSNLIGRTNK